MKRKRYSKVTIVSILKWRDGSASPVCRVVKTWRRNTKILFESNGQAKTARGEVRTTKLKLDQGSILSRVQKLAQRDSRFEISTPTATSFIRGTEFRVKVRARRRHPSRGPRGPCRLW